MSEDLYLRINKKDLPKGSHTPIFTCCRQLVEEETPYAYLEVYGPSLINETQEILHMRVNIKIAAKWTVNEETTAFRRYRTQAEHFEALKAGKSTGGVPHT